MTEYNIPYKENYAIPSGVTAWVAKLNGTVYDDFICIGNIIDGMFNQENELFEHFTNIFGKDSKDKVITIKKNATIRLDFDELVRDNLIFLLGSSIRTVDQIIYIRKPEQQTFSSNEIQVNNGSDIYDVEAVKPLSGEVEYTEGATGDYTVNTTDGTITRTATSDIGATDTVIVYYRVSKTSTKYNLGDATEITGKLWIICHGTEVGPSKAIYCPSVEIKPEGEIALFGKTEPIKGSLMFHLLEDSSNKFGNWYQW